MKRKSFTLQEVLVVIVIISILFIVVTVHLDFLVERSKTDALDADLQVFDHAIVTSFYQNMGFPESKTELVSDLNACIDPKYRFTELEEYFVSEEEDPWGNQYQFSYLENAETGAREITILYNTGVKETGSKTYSFVVKGNNGKLLVNGKPYSVMGESETVDEAS